MTAQERIDRKLKVILLARDTESASILYNYVTQFVPFAHVIIENPIPDWDIFRKRVKKLGLLKTVGQVVFLFTVSPVLGFLTRKRRRAIFTEYQLSNQPIPAAHIKRVSSVNTDECRELLKELDPDLVVVNGTRIIAEKTITCIPAPFINIHDGITPAYRGVHGGYWAMATGRPDLFGTTIHYVDKGIDTGNIIEQVFIQPKKGDNFTTYPLLQHAAALPVLVGIIQRFEKEDRIPVKPAVCENRPLWYHPTIFQWIKNAKRTLLISDKHPA